MKIVLQETEYDCGPACLKFLAQTYDLKKFKNKPIKYFAETVQCIPKNGTHTYDLVNFLTTIGLKPVEHRTMNMPHIEAGRAMVACIDEMGHWVVVMPLANAGGAEASVYFVYDPTDGMLIWSKKELADRWKCQNGYYGVMV